MINKQPKGRARRYASASKLSAGVLVVAGLVLIAGAGGGVWLYGRSVNRTVNVVVAREAVPPLSPVLPGMVVLQPRPQSSIGQARAYLVTSAVIGKWVRYGLVPGQIVRPAELASSAVSASQLDMQITDAGKTVGKGAVAVPLALDEPHGFTMPAPNDHVDLLAVAKNGKNSQARVILQHILVLDVLDQGGQNTTPTPVGLGGGSPAAASTPAAQQGVLILAMSPKDAETLALAVSNGGVTLLLQPLKDNATALPAPVSWTDVFPASTGKSNAGAATAPNGASRAS